MPHGRVDKKVNVFKIIGRLTWLPSPRFGERGWGGSAIVVILADWIGQNFLAEAC